MSKPEVLVFALFGIAIVIAGGAMLGLMLSRVKESEFLRGGFMFLLLINSAAVIMGCVASLVRWFLTRQATP